MAETAEEFAVNLESLAKDRDLLGIGEEATKHALVLPVLEWLGWNVRSIREVVPEFAMDDGRVDYCLQIDRKPRVFVEAKAVDRDLQEHQKQLLGYAFSRGVELAVLTNGFSWWLYLPLVTGSWEERKFFVIDIREQSPLAASTNFFRFLSRESVQSGRALDEARTVRESGKRRTEINEALPKAWQKLLSEPDERLIDLLAVEVESICGHKPDSDTIAAHITKQLGPPPRPNAAKSALEIRMSGVPGEFRP